MTAAVAWLELRIGLQDRSSLAALEAVLEAAGAVALTLSDAGDTPILEPAPGETPLWPTLTLTALFPSDIDRAKVAADLGDAPLDWREVADRAWEREWLKDYAPLEFGATLWVGPHDTSPADAGRAAVHIEPGLGFGSGTHPTTALCLEWLATAPLQGARVLDYGCGSGILAISALALRAGIAVAVDIDAQALDATRANGARNGVSDRLEVYHADRLPRSEFDVVIANILANPLKTLADHLVSLVVPGGTLVLAGLLDEQATDVAASYAPDVDLVSTAERDGWTLLTGRRPA